MNEQALKSEFDALHAKFAAAQFGLRAWLVALAIAFSAGVYLGHVL